MLFAILVASAGPARARTVSLFCSPVVGYHGLGLASRCYLIVTCWPCCRIGTSSCSVPNGGLTANLLAALGQGHGSLTTGVPRSTDP
jgi:hypothetical protein